MVARPWPGGEKRRGGHRITRHWKRLGRFSTRVRLPGCPCLRCGAHSARALCVAMCAAHACATRGSIAPLLSPQLLANKEMTSRHTVGIPNQLMDTPGSRSSRSPCGKRFHGNRSLPFFYRYCLIGSQLSKLVHLPTGPFNLDRGNLCLLPQAKR